MKKLLTLRPFVMLGAVLAIFAGCANERPATDRGTDAPPRNETAPIVRLTEQEYVDEHHGQGIVIDVRSPSEVAQGHLVEAANIDVQAGDFRTRVNELARDATYYLYCRTGNRSGQAAKIMAEMGFQSLYNIGGFAELANAGADTAR